MTIWTEENIATLERMWADGEVASEIAFVIGHGLTRSAVMGKIHRMGLPKRSDQPHRMNAVEDMRKRRAAAELERSEKRMAVPKKSSGARGLSFRISEARKSGVTDIKEGMAMVLDRGPKLLKEDGVDVTGLIGLMQLTQHTCRWPIGDPKTPDFGFCGEGVEEVGKPYCSAHTARAKATPRNT